MRNPSEPAGDGKGLREKLIGLGEFSHRKSYYPELQRRMEELERFQAFLNHSNDAIFLIEVPTAHIVDLTDSACRQLGWERREILGRSVYELSELGRNLQAAELLGGSGLGPEGALVETLLLRRDGSPLPVEVTLDRMRFREAEYVIAVARDIAKRKEAEEALAERVRLAELGAAAGGALAEGGSLEVTLQRCAQLLVRHTEAAFGRIWTVSREDPELLELRASAGMYTSIRGRHSRKRLGEGKVGIIARQRKPYLTNAVIGDAAITDQEWARREQMVAFAGYPLVVGDRLVGVVALFFRQPMTEAVLTSIAAVAHAIAVGIERQRTEEALWESEKRRLRLQTELEMAASIQEKLLPAAAPQLTGFEFAARCLPARQVGGDFYDWQLTEPGVLSLTLGDVMGKGMAAALLMATVRSSLRAVSQVRSPVAALDLAEKALHHDLESSESFVTLFHARLEAYRRRLTFVDCGHGLVFVRRHDGRVLELQPRGLPFGVAGGEAFREGEITLAPGDALILYSDGLIDLCPELGLDNPALARRLRDATSAAGMLQSLFALVPPGTERPDDLTVLIVRCASGTELSVSV